MTNDAQNRIKELFQAAARREPSDRPAYLDEACRGDAVLRSAVESLLAAGDEAGSFLEGPPPLQSAAGPSDEDLLALQSTVTADSRSLEPAQVFDRYRLLEKLGEGGMGEVWLAEQQEPVRRRVALKVIKAGMDTAQVIARFEAERQALALMDHPAIARVFDAGATPAGRPYFVMEHVAGLPITQHCDRNRFSTRERLELFLQVCEGVQHAHQKAVLHRDLKPSNVLVSSHDGRAAPKIIDFGLAKAMAQPLTARTLYTGLGMLIGTPGYMSPEQADLTGRDIDTRTDVYSLGVMLYELLVGVLPFDKQKLRRAGLEGLGGLLRDEEPPTPSRRLTTLPPEVSTEAASGRRTDVPALRRQLAGDLDWIAMKAIEHDRERRYGSPSELAEDIRRHLRDEPVLAGPPGAAYRMGKFVRRHRLGVAVASVLMLAVGGGLIGTTLGLVRAQRAETEARKQAETSERVSGFLADLLGSVDPERMGRTLVADLRERVGEAEKMRGGDAAQVAAVQAAFDDAFRDVNRVDAARQLVDTEILARAGETIDKEMSDEPLVAARLQATLGSTYHELGLFASAASFHLKALETRRRRLGPEHADTLRSMTELGRAIYSSGRAADAEPILQEALETQRRVLGPENPDTLRTMNDLAYAKSFMGKGQESEQLYRDTLEIRRRVLGREHPDTTHTMRLLADNLVVQDRGAEAESLYSEAIDIQRRVLGPEHTETLRSMGNMARALVLLKRYEDAERLSKEVIDIRRRINGEDSIFTILSLGYLGLGYRAQGRHEEADLALADALDRARRSEASTVTTWFGGLMAESYEAQGRLPEAEKLRREILEIRRRVGPQAQIADDLLPVARLVVLQGKHQDAEQLYREALEIQSRDLGMDHPATLGTLTEFAFFYMAAGKSGPRAYIQSFVATIRSEAEKPEATPGMKNLYAAWLLLAEPADMRDPQQAIPFALAAVAGTQRKDANILDTLALAYHMTGRHEEAVRTQREAIALLPAGPSPLREELERNLATFEEALGR